MYPRIAYTWERERGEGGEGEEEKDIWKTTWAAIAPSPRVRF